MFVLPICSAQFNMKEYGKIYKYSFKFDQGTYLFKENILAW